MKQAIFILIGCLLLNPAFTQPPIKRDTAYTLQSSFESTVKTYPNISLVPVKNSPTVKAEKNIVYTTSPRSLVMDVFFPVAKTSSKKTAIIFIHGGGWRGGDRNLHYALAERLAESGYVCFTPEYRLSPEALYPAAVYDLKAAVRWVRKNAAKYNIDTNRIVASGHSAGGELAVFLGATNNNPQFEGTNSPGNFSSRVNAVMDIDGLLAFIHPESGEGDDSKRISAATQWFGVPKNEGSELWKQGSPLTHVSASNVPTLFINSNAERMHAGRDDYLKLLSQYNIYSEVKTFDGPHLFVFFEPWFTPMVETMDQFLQKIFPASIKQPTTIIVAADGSGLFKTVTEAINEIPYNNTSPVTIYIKNGLYKEKILLDSTKDNVTLMGEDKFKTILSYNDHTGKLSPAGDTINTRTSWSFKIKANDFKGLNITFQNDAGFNAGQAVAVESDGDKTIFDNCRFIGNQDVLFTNNDSSRQFYKDCYIEGTTDFIFGSSTVWFERCHIYSKKNSHITAASTPKEKMFGYIFNDCFLTGDTSLHSVSLGRPWRPYANVVYMNCYMGPHIKPEGWSNWNNTDNYLTTRYAEYHNYGPGANPVARVKWATQLTDELRKVYTIINVFNGWNPIQ